MTEYTKKEQKEIDKINTMTQVEMARLRRFAPLTHPYFDNTLPYYKIFSDRFEELGGMLPSVSKEIGW